MRAFIYLLIFFFSIQPLYADIRFLTIADIHYGSNNKVGEGNDTGEILLNTAFAKFSQLADQVDFIITLGDLPTHMIKTTPKKFDYLKYVFHKLYVGDKTDKPMFYVTGNNDSIAGNYQPFSLNGESTLKLAEDWQGACVHCKNLIIDGQHMWDEGYYSSYVLPGNKDIILIALNSVQMSYPSSIFIHYPDQDKDARQQLLWLENQLKTHQAKQLLIAMHIPPGNTYLGNPFWKVPYLQEFIKLLNQNNHRYGQISLLTAHTHMDDIRKISMKECSNIYAYATPSISRIHYNYPAMKIFDLGKNMQVKDYTTYYTTHDDYWSDEHYHARKDIFPQCDNTSLDKYLDKFSPDSICRIFITGQFYGVKNSHVNAAVCETTFPIN